MNDGQTYKTVRHAAKALARRHAKSLGGGWFRFRGKNVQGLWHFDREVERVGNRLGYGKWFMFWGVLDSYYGKARQ